MSDPTGTTFEPDWMDLFDAAKMTTDGTTWEQAAKTATKRLRRQLREAGWVLVRREPLQRICQYAGGADPYLFDWVKPALDEILAATGQAGE